MRGPNTYDWLENLGGGKVYGHGWRWADRRRDKNINSGNDIDRDGYKRKRT